MFAHILQKGRHEDCHALCRQGLPVTLYTNRLACSADECLAYYGLSPHPDLRIVQLFGGPWQRLALGRELQQIMAAAPPGRHVVMSRGETGIALFARLRALNAPSNATFTRRIACVTPRRRGW